MDETDMKPGVAERKWEIDSLCHPIRLAHGYWRATDASEVEAALNVHGRRRDAHGNAFFAYETDGFGNSLFMDDANIPGLLSMSYLGCCARNDPVYVNTRKRVWSSSNPYFFKGTAANGIGGPHVGLKMIWPMSIMMRA